MCDSDNKKNIFHLIIEYINFRTQNDFESNDNM